MPTSRTQMVTLCFIYTHQHAALVGAYDQNHIKLANLCLDHLRSLSQLEDDPCYPWECFPDAVNADYDLVEVSVRFVHKRYEQNSTLALPHARQLWHTLVERFDHEPSHMLFGGRIYSMNMRSVSMQDGLETMPLTFGRMIASIPIDMEHPIQVADVPDMSKGNSLALAADTFLYILESGARGAAIHATLTSGKPALDLALAGTLLSSSIQHNQTNTLPADTITSSAAQIDQPSIPTVGTSLSFNTVAQLVGQYKENLSLATVIQLVGSNSDSFMLIAQASAEARKKIQPMMHQNITKEEVSQIAEVTHATMSKFQNADLAAVAHVRHCLETKFPSAETYKEAMQRVCELRMLSVWLVDGSKNLTTVLQNQRKSRNTNLATVMTCAGVSVVAALLGPPGWAAAGLAYLGTGVAAASAPYLLIKKVEENGQIEGLTQNRGDIEKVHRKLFFLIVTAFVTDIWKYDLDRLPLAEKEKLFRGFGVHEECLTYPNYTKAHIKAALDELEQVHKGLVYGLEGVFLDLGIAPGETRKPIQKPTIPIQLK